MSQTKFSPDETPLPKVSQPRNGSKHHRREYDSRPGRLTVSEHKYRHTRTHTGKGTTLRSHRLAQKNKNVRVTKSDD